jgi:hypothetical protein
MGSPKSGEIAKATGGTPGAGGGKSPQEMMRALMAMERPQVRRGGRGDSEEGMGMGGGLFGGGNNQLAMLLAAMRGQQPAAPVAPVAPVKKPIAYENTGKKPWALK